MNEAHRGFFSANIAAVIKYGMARRVNRPKLRQVPVARHWAVITATGMAHMGPSFCQVMGMDITTNQAVAQCSQVEPGTGPRCSANGSNRAWGIFRRLGLERSQASCAVMPTVASPNFR